MVGVASAAPQGTLSWKMNNSGKDGRLTLVPQLAQYLGAPTSRMLSVFPHTKNRGMHILSSGQKRVGSELVYYTP